MKGRNFVVLVLLSRCLREFASLLTKSEQKVFVVIARSFARDVDEMNLKCLGIFCES